MKRFLFLLAIIPTLSFAQEKGDNAILIPANDMAEEKIMSALLSSGYPVDKSSKDYFTTQPVKKKGSSSIKLSIYRKDSSTYIIRGWFNITNVGFYGQDGAFQQIAFKGLKGSAMKQAWTEMDLVAKKIDESVTYTKL